MLTIKSPTAFVIQNMFQMLLGDQKTLGLQPSWKITYFTQFLYNTDSGPEYSCFVNFGLVSSSII